MARARNIKPGFFTNDDLAEVEPLGRLLFIGLWTIADREGRLEDRPKRIKAELLPYDDANADDLLSALAEHGFILRYSVDGTGYIQVLNFAKHQNPHVKEGESTIAAPCLSGASAVQALGEEQPLPAPAGLIPDSGFLIPDSPSLIPEVAPAVAAAARKPRDVEGKSTAVWQAYSEAYRNRYQTDPVRNAKVSGQLCQLVDRLGNDEAPQVASFYVRHNKSVYTSRRHSVDLLLHDAESLRTDWATGKQSTVAAAVQADKTQTNFNAFAPLLEKARREAEIAQS